MTTPANTSGTAKKLSEFFKSLDTRIRVPLVNAFASNKGEPDLTRRLEGASSKTGPATRAASPTDRGSIAKRTFGSFSFANQKNMLYFCKNAILNDICWVIGVQYIPSTDEKQRDSVDGKSKRF